MNKTLLKILKYVLAPAALLIYLFIESQGEGDFHIFITASQDLFNHENIFEKHYGLGFHYFYSVFFAILLHPLTYLPFQISKFLWLTLNCFFIFRIFQIIKNLLPLNNFSKNQLLFLRIAGFAFAFRFIFENIHYSQMTIFLLFLCLQGLQLIFSNKPVAGAFLIALGINIKLLPLVLLPYLFYRKFFVAGVLVILFYVGLLLVPIIFIGYQQNNFLLSNWFHLINPINTNHILDVEERSFHSLSTLLSTLLIQHVPDIHAMNLKRNIIDVSVEQLHLILNIARCSFIVFSLYFLRSLPFKSPLGMKHRFWETSYLLLLIPLIFPHQQHYGFLFICPAFIFCLYHLIQNKNTIPKTKYFFLVTLSILIYLLCNLKILLGEFNEYYEHYKILSYGALLLIVLLANCIPNKDEKEITLEV